jgi:hypothetical protein
MSDTEILRQILSELKGINNTIQDLYSGAEAQHELLMNRLLIMESIVNKSNDILSNIDNNTNT